jgi:hypothetical protein
MRRWENNIKMHFQEVGCGQGLDHYRDRWEARVNAAMTVKVS